MSTLVTIVHVLVCIFLMLTVLLQAGKGGGMGAAFGGGSSSGTVFGGSGAGGFLRKLTVIAATIFMLSSMTLAYLASATGEDSLKQYSVQQRQAAEEKQRLHQEALEAEGATAPDEAVDPAEGAALEGATEGEALEGTSSELEATEQPVEPLGSPLEAEDVEADEPAPPAGETAEPTEPAEPTPPAGEPTTAPAGAGSAPEPGAGAEAGSP